MNRGTKGAIGLLAGCLLSLIVFKATLYNILPFLVASLFLLCGGVISKIR